MNTNASPRVVPGEMHCLPYLVGTLFPDIIKQLASALVPEASNSKY